MSEFPSLFDAHGALLSQLGIAKDGQEGIAVFVDRLWEANRELNLFSRTMTEDRFFHEHVLDCLVVLPHLASTTGDRLDLGTGGGLPGALLALADPHHRWILADKSVRKTKKLAQLLVGVPNTTVRHICVPGPVWPKAELVVTRAVKPLGTLLKWQMQSGGLGPNTWFLMKGRRVGIEEELHQAGSLLKDFRVTVLPLPHPTRSLERHLVILQSCQGSQA
jgi:16S rRNA G527 N7-methylase RsmG